MSIVDVDVAGRRVWHLPPVDDRWPAWNANGIATLDASDADSGDDTVTASISEGDLIVAGTRGDTNPHLIAGFGRVVETDPDRDLDDIADSVRTDTHSYGVEWMAFDTAIPITLGHSIPLAERGSRELDAAEFSHVLGTTLMHAIAGGLFESVSDAVAVLEETMAVPIQVLTNATPTNPDGGAEDPPQPDPPDPTTPPWQYGEVDTPSPNFSLTPADISLDGLYFENETELLERTLAALERGDHLLFVGPPGTGKSKLAEQLASEITTDDAYRMTTATADWSTFNTIGGYQQTQGGSLAFSPGLFIDCFQDAAGRPTNEWLIVDEFNRANIDKALGSFFSVLAGDDVVLPFERDGEDVVVYGSEPKSSASISPHEFVVPSEWRLLATMNSFDKSSLYDLSYALSRRFAYIHLPAPEPDAITTQLVQQYVDCWDDVSPTPEQRDAVVALWRAVQSERPLGPAIVHDILAAAGSDLTPGVLQHVLPQFEGLMNRTQETLLTQIAETGAVDVDEIERFGSQYFELADLDLPRG